MLLKIWSGKAAMQDYCSDSQASHYVTFVDSRALDYCAVGDHETSCTPFPPHTEIRAVVFSDLNAQTTGNPVRSPREFLAQDTSCNDFDAHDDRDDVVRDAQQTSNIISAILVCGNTGVLSFNKRATVSTLAYFPPHNPLA
jgi:hypothetical protein